jgi:hypothetical protein
MYVRPHHQKHKLEDAALKVMAVIVRGADKIVMMCHQSWDYGYSAGLSHNVKDDHILLKKEL